MLVRHSLIYLLARGVPGALEFVAIAIYARLLSPEEYGEYALVMATVTLFNAVFYEWLRLGLLRFLPSLEGEKRRVLLSTILCGFLLVSGLLTAAVILIRVFWPGVSSSNSVGGLGLVSLLLTAAFYLHIEVFRTDLEPWRYGLLTLVKSLATLASSIAFIYAGFGTPGMLMGVSLGFFVPLLITGHTKWRGTGFRLVDRKILAELLKYGAPLTITFALGFIVNSSDRFFIGRLLGSDAVGQYAVAYDLTQKSLVFVIHIVYLAAYPLVVKALTEGGEAAARDQLAHNFQLLMALGLPACVGFALLSPNISHVFLGPGYSQAAAIIMPWVALTSLLQSVKAYYQDQAFQLGKNTNLQMWPAAITAGSNLALNALLIPMYGLSGAVHATWLAYVVGVVATGYWGNKAFYLPIPYKEVIPIGKAVTVMCACLLPTLGMYGKTALAAQVALGVVGYGLGMTLFNVLGFRDRLLRIWDRAAGRLDTGGVVK